MDHLEEAKEYVTLAEREVETLVAEHLTQCAIAHALISVAESLKRLAYPPMTVRSGMPVLDEDDILRLWKDHPEMFKQVEGAMEDLKHITP